MIWTIQVQYAADDAFVGVAALLAMTIEHISSRTNFKPSDSTAAYNEVAEEAFKLCLPYAEKRFTNGNKQSKAPKSAGENDFEKSVNILCPKFMDLDLFQL